LRDRPPFTKITRLCVFTQETFWNFEAGGVSMISIASVCRWPPRLIRKGRFAVLKKSIRSFLHAERHLSLERQARRTTAVGIVVATSIAGLVVANQQYPAWFSIPQAQSEQIADNRPQIEEVELRSVAYQKEVERNRAISAFLAKRYRVSHEMALDFVRIAFAAGHRMGVDPLLVLAVMAVESRLNPIAESEAGAKGLMQIIPKFHPEKFVEFGGEQAIFEPQTNIVVGSQILREYIQRAGDVSDGLRIYGGGPLEGENSYPSRVLDEKRRLQHVLSQQRRAARDGPPNRVAL
jgi:hypothetical protein